jgi:predicted dehydrogenase
MIRVGIIGLDSTHAVEFMRRINSTAHSSQARVVVACPVTPTDFPPSTDRRDEIERQCRDELDLPIVGRIEEVISQVDAVMLLGCDGRAHHRDVLPVLSARKPVFIDKPLTADWREAVGIVDAARFHSTPLFSASALRFRPDVEASRRLARSGSAQVTVFVPQRLVPGHPDLSWLGIHGVEAAFALFGPGCRTVQRTITPAEDVTIGRWQNGATALVYRSSGAAGRDFLTTVRSVEGIATARGHDYDGLIAAILAFFQSGEPPISSREMLEVLAFIAAADHSRDADGTSIELSPLLADAAL